MTPEEIARLPWNLTKEQERLDALPKPSPRSDATPGSYTLAAAADGCDGDFYRRVLDHAITELLQIAVEQRDAKPGTAVRALAEAAKVAGSAMSTLLVASEIERLHAKADAAVKAAEAARRDLRRPGGAIIPPHRIAAERPDLLVN